MMTFTKKVSDREQDNFGGGEVLDDKVEVRPSHISTLLCRRMVLDTTRSPPTLCSNRSSCHGVLTRLCSRLRWSQVIGAEHAKLFGAPAAADKGGSMFDDDEDSVW